MKKINFKIVLYIALSFASIFTAHFMFLLKNTPEFDYQVYFNENQIIANESELTNSLNEAGINLYINENNRYYYISNESKLINKLPQPFIKSNDSFLDIYNREDWSGVIYMNTNLDIEDATNHLNQIFNNEAVVVPDKSVSIYANDYVYVAILFLVIYIYLIMVFVIRTLKFKNSIIIYTLNGKSKNNILKKISPPLTIYEVISILILNILLTFLITKPISNISIYVFLISIGVISFMEYMLYITVDLFYQQLVKSSAINFLNKTKNVSKTYILSLTLLVGTVAISSLILPGIIEGLNDNFRSYLFNQQADQKFGEFYFKGPTLREYGTQIDLTTTSKFATYEFYLQENELTTTENYLPFSNSNLEVECTNKCPVLYDGSSKTDIDSNFDNPYLIEKSEFKSLISIPFVKINQIQILDDSAHGSIIGVNNKSELDEYFAETKLNKNAFLFVTKYHDYIVNQNQVILISTSMYLFFLALLIVVLYASFYLHVSITAATQIDSHTMKLFAGQNFYERYKKYLFSSLLTIFIVIFTCSIFNQRLVTNMWIFLIEALLFITLTYLIDNRQIVKTLRERIGQND